jgi:hypothetical protein
MILDLAYAHFAVLGRIATWVARSHCLRSPAHAAGTELAWT